MNITELKNRTKVLLEEVASIIHPEGLNQIREFIQVNEIKLAVETICDHIGDTAIEITPQLKLKIKELARELSIPDVYWNNL